MRVTLGAALEVAYEPGDDLVVLEEALQALARVDERKARVIELRFFGGLSVEETASVLNVSRETVLRDWRLAKAWLRELEQAPGRTANAPRGAPGAIACRVAWIRA